MVTDQTIEKLMNLRLAAMAGAFVEQRQKPAMTQLGFDERFGLVVYGPIRVVSVIDTSSHAEFFHTSAAAANPQSDASCAQPACRVTGR